jgi:hypothetical protein
MIAGNTEYLDPLEMGIEQNSNGLYFLSPTGRIYYSEVVCRTGIGVL